MAPCPYLHGDVRQVCGGGNASRYPGDRGYDISAAYHRSERISETGSLEEAGLRTCFHRFLNIPQNVVVRSVINKHLLASLLKQILPL